ncbi:MAG: galactose oxidase early set domain-containing protein [Xenococcaceae cyanobacterium]
MTILLFNRNRVLLHGSTQTISERKISKQHRRSLWQRLILICVAFVTVISLWSLPIQKVVASEICSSGDPSPLEKQLRKAIGDAYSSTILTYEGCPEEMGAWYMLPMPQDEKDRMQAVHAILLPSNKVLIANGSSNRNRVGDDGTIQDNIDTGNYDVVNNTNIFTPSLSDPFYTRKEHNFVSNPFKRIDSPITPLQDNEPNDLFCSGHLHLSDGNVMFAGGTRLYYPGVKFQGGKFVNVFDWKSETWDETPEGTHFHTMEDGRWYPTLIPLSDGAIAIVSGLPADKFNEVNSIVEIYNPNLRNSKKWQAIDIRDKKNSPFQTLMRPDEEEIYTPDYIDLYPRIFPVKNSKEKEDTFLITGDGGGKDTLPKHMSFRSYFMTFTKNNYDTYEITFEPGPKREGVTKVYGTASLDPTSENGDVLLYGGLVGANDISFGPGKYAIEGSSMSADVERWNAPNDFDQATQKGDWDLYENYLSHVDEDILQKTDPNSYPPKYEYEKQASNLGRYGTRAMELAVVLPTKQILIVNGGNYAEHRPVFNPTLMTPDGSSDGFSTKLMNPDDEARMYHNTALLLPDARVLVMGGNPSRAARYSNGEVETATIRDFEFASKGTYFLSAEVYRHAIFYPPYLFGSTERPEIETEILELEYSTENTIEVTHRSAGDQESLVLIKLGSVTHSFDAGQRFEGLNIESVSTVNGKTQLKFTAPDNRLFTPPGYYMLFYVSGSGMPSHAKIVGLHEPA